MSSAGQGYRVAVIGAGSLLGKEVIAVLKERDFPTARLVTPDALDEEEPDLPVLDLMGDGAARFADADAGDADLDFAFLAGPLAMGSKISAGGDSLPFLQSAKQLAAATQCTVIDLRDSLTGESGGILLIPVLDRAGVPSASVERKNPAASRFVISAHPATIVLSTILLRLASRVTLQRVVAHVFGAASEIGSHGIEELQRQTSSLLSFQKLPQSVFGAQLAFNLLPRLGRGRKVQPGLESRIQAELVLYLGGRVPAPALRVIQVPVFHSMACSLYVELSQPAAPELLSQSLAGAPIQLRKSTEPAPTQVEVSGSDDIIVDAILPDGQHSAGYWIWAAADNLRLAALNAVEIAENMAGEKPARSQ